MKGTVEEYLIAHASHYDLVNLTTQEIIANVTYARKVHEALPYLGEKLEDGLWREWVLPNKVLDEDVDLWRKDFYEGISPLLVNAKTTREAAEAVLKWVWSDHGDGSRIVLESHTAESRNRSVNQLLASKQSACREFNLLYVAALRSVGIPARHCGVGRWLHRDSYHFFAEYWDAEQEEWVAVDTSDDKLVAAQSPAERAVNGRWNSLVYYAYPGNPDEPDLYGKGRWDKMVRITGNLADEFPMEIGWPEPGRGGTLSAQIWNGGSWRTILIREVKDDENPVVVSFGKTHVTTRPVLFSADVGGERYLAMVDAVPLNRKVVLEKFEAGRSLTWSPAGDGLPEEEGQ